MAGFYHPRGTPPHPPSLQLLCLLSPPQGSSLLEISRSGPNSMAILLAGLNPHSHPKHRVRLLPPLRRHSWAARTRLRLSCHHGDPGNHRAPHVVELGSKGNAPRQSLATFGDNNGVGPAFARDPQDRYPAWSAVALTLIPFCLFKAACARSPLIFTLNAPFL